MTNFLQVIIILVLVDIYQQLKEMNERQEKKNADVGNRE